MPAVGLMPVQWTGFNNKAINVHVRPQSPNGCPGCGRVMPAPHPWGCPVLLRLSAQLLHGGYPMEWRLKAVLLAGRPSDPWCPEARHWRQVAEADDPVDPDGPGHFHTPNLYPCEDGMFEGHDDDDDHASRPGSAAAILTPQLVDTLNHAFGPAGWELCPSPFPELDPQPLAEDEPCLSPAASPPPPPTLTPPSPTSSSPSGVSPAEPLPARSS